MDDAEVGEQAVVAACAFVPVGMKVAARSMVAGIPARLKRSLGDADVAWNAEATRAYHDLTGRCLASLRETGPLPRVEPDRQRLPSTKVDALIQARNRGTGAA